MVGVLGLALGTAAALPFLHRPAPAPTMPSSKIVAGREIYASHCAACHGVDLKGQANWQRPGTDGYFPAPPHDASGHTWQHSDTQLHELIANSVYAYAAPGYRSHMPAFGKVLSGDQIDAVIAFIKSTWPASIQAYQRVLNEGGKDFRDLPPDWKFPPTCRFHERS
jgi:mono/diheme cytochrome c family protein